MNHFFVLILFFCVACGNKYQSPSVEYQNSISQNKDYFGGAEMYEEEPLLQSRGTSSFKRKISKSKEKKEDNQVQTEQISGNIHYNGHAKLQVARMEESIQEILGIAKKNNGSLESRGANYITVRIPQKKFTLVFSEILGVGAVITKSITAQDLSQAFQSTSLRLKTAKSTRDRLLELLNKSKDEKEKIAILKEIQRLNEQIDTIESQLRTLDNLSKMSRITIELQARQNQDIVQTQEAAGFEWIQNLNPFQDDVLSEGKRFKLPVPEGMVLLNKKGLFTAQAADGSFVRAATLRNQPQGSAEFWQNAVEKRISGGFAQSSTEKIGDYRAVSFLSDSDNPYTYILALKTDKNKLHVVEIYYPDSEQKERYHQKVLTALGGE
jgi:TolA-binding protein